MTLDYIHINKKSAVPLYDQVRSSILEAIKEGILPPGAKLPTEDEICKMFQVSRTVVRQAYSSLTNEGLIARERGKGTFVKEAADNRGLFMHRITTFKEEMQLLGKVPRTVVLSKKGLALEEAPSAFKDVETEGVCYYLERMRYADEKPFEYCENYLPLHRFPGLTGQDFGSGSLYEYLEKECGVKIARARRSIRAENANARIAGHLGISRGAAILVVESQVFDQYDRLVEVSVEAIAGDSHQYDFDIYNN